MMFYTSSNSVSLFTRPPPPLPPPLSSPQEKRKTDRGGELVAPAKVGVDELTAVEGQGHDPKHAEIEL